MNYEQLDVILKKYGNIVMDKAKEEGISIDYKGMWRWDQPELNISWIDNTAKNIVIYVDPNNYQVKVECNTWLDASAGKNSLRLWEHQEIGMYDPKDIDEITAAIEQAIDLALSWDLTDLKRRNITKR